MADTKNKFIGNKGEELATNWLMQNNYVILHRNWRFKKTEVDIIASKKNVLHFVEVKTRTSDRYGLPEESITTKKMEALKKAAAAFLEEYTTWKNIQFDVMAITLDSKNLPSYFLIEDVYF